MSPAHKRRVAENPRFACPFSNIGNSSARTWVGGLRRVIPRPAKRAEGSHEGLRVPVRRKALPSTPREIPRRLRGLGMTLRHAPWPSRNSIATATRRRGQRDAGSGARPPCRGRCSSCYKRASASTIRSRMVIPRPAERAEGSHEGLRVPVRRKALPGTPREIPRRLRGLGMTLRHAPWPSRNSIATATRRRGQRDAGSGARPPCRGRCSSCYKRASASTIRSRMVIPRPAKRAEGSHEGLRVRSVAKHYPAPRARSLAVFAGSG